MKAQKAACLLILRSQLRSLHGPSQSAVERTGRVFGATAAEKDQTVLVLLLIIILILAIGGGIFISKFLFLLLLLLLLLLLFRGRF
jgi:hypothetical protein